MDRSNAFRRIGWFCAFSGWVFLLLSLASFSRTDWPSHDVYPYPETQNLCGSVGAFVAYYCYFLIGQGVFPVLFFAGVVLALVLFQGKVTDVWMRVIGAVLLAVAFAAAIHHFKIGSAGGFSEGRGGILGIGVSTFLQSRFSNTGTLLILLASIIIGLILAADDLLLKAPAVAREAFGATRGAMDAMKAKTAGMSLPSMPKLAWPARSQSTDTDEEDVDSRPIAKAAKPKKSKEEIDLSYDNDEPIPAAVEHAFMDDGDPAPSAAAVIPPPQPVLTADEKSALIANDDPTGENDPSIHDAPADATAEEPKPIAPPEIRQDIVVKLNNTLRPRQSAPPPPPPKELGEYHLPGWDCLEEAEGGYAESQEQFVREQAALLEQSLKEFQIEAQVVEIDTGPVITMYELSLAPGVKVSTISGLSNDIQRSLKAESVRIVAPIPGKNTVGIEVPNEQKEKVRFKDLMSLATPEALAKCDIPLFLGKDASGEPLLTDLTKMPHCLIAGTTGSGKSVCINTIIMSIMYKQRPDMVKLVLFDPKVVEMAMYKDIPHLMCPVINDASKATGVLEWACEKMDERYEFLAEAGVRNIKGYNSLTQEELIERFQPSTPEEEAKIPKKLPYIVIIIDELADLMMTSGKEVEQSIVRIAQKARAVGIHLILATQRPSANVVTGLIKSNMPSRIAFRVQSKMDSRIVLDQNGAECLLGHGDMLFLPPGASKPTRSQGTFIDDKEVRDSVKLVKSMAEAQYEPELVQLKALPGADGGDMEKDELFDDAVRVVLETKRGSVSLLQRRLTIGYSRASRLIEQMAQAGIVGDYKGSQAREATITLDEWEAMKSAQQTDESNGMSV
jgi:S-DNA-T family DNA segregation ATPase FtsK/SpoIIIE